MNRLLIIFFILASGLVVNAENVSALIPPQKPTLKIKNLTGKRSPDVPNINPQQKISKHSSNESLKYEREVYTDSSDTRVIEHINHIAWKPSTLKNIEIIYDVASNRFNNFSYKCTVSNAPLEEKHFTDSLMKQVMIDLKKYKLPKFQRFKIYFVQNNSSNFSTEPVVSYRYNYNSFTSPSPKFLPYSSPLKKEFKISLNDTTSSYFYAPSVVSKVQEYDSNIDMNFVPPSIHVENKGMYYCDNCDLLESKLFENWTPINDNISRNVVFIVNSIGFGNHLSYKLLSSSNDPSVDKSAIIALYNTVVDYPFNDYRVTFHSGAPDTPNFENYLTNVSFELTQNWKPYDKEHSVPIEVEICVSDTGEIFSWHIVKSSKNQKQDDAVINSILLANSLPHFPEYYRGNYIKLRITYNVDKISEMKDNNIDLAPDFLKVYYKKIFSIISLNFETKKMYNTNVSPLETKFFIRLDRGGKVLNSQIVKPSGSKIFDDLVLNAISLSSFPPFPKEYNNNFIDLILIYRFNRNL